MGIRKESNTTITGFASTTFTKMTSHYSILTLSALLLVALTACGCFPHLGAPRGAFRTSVDITSDEHSDLPEDLVERRYRRSVVVLKPVKPVLKKFRVRNPYRTSHRRVLPRYPSYRGYGSPARPDLKPFRIDYPKYGYRSYPSYQGSGSPVRPDLKPFNIDYPHYG